jgi:hypothetical protein
VGLRRVRLRNPEAIQIRRLKGSEIQAVLSSKDERGTRSSYRIPHTLSVVIAFLKVLSIQFDFGREFDGQSLKFNRLVVSPLSGRVVTGLLI